MFEPSLDEMTFGQWARYRRTALGLSQTEVAARAGMAQSNLAAIETGRRGAGAQTVAALRSALTALPSELLARNRARLLKSAKRNGIANIRIFGSVARGEDHDEASDIDLLVDLPKTDSAAAYIAFIDEAARILTISVDVVGDRAATDDPVLATARAEATPL